MMEFNEIWKAVLKLAVEQAKNIKDDQKALEVKVLYEQWENQIGKNLAVGEYIQYDGKLYRVLQAHVAQPNWIPGVGTESLFIVIEKKCEGTINDPIPFVQNMELFNGKYYIQNDVLYLCNRDSVIPMYHDLSALVGMYVEVVK